MKILHIWNTAGVPSVIAKNMDHIFGTESTVIARQQFTPYHETYGCAVPGDTLHFYIHLLYHLLRDYDLIHVHGLDQRISLIKRLKKKPVVLQYHGSRIRGRWEQRRKYWSKADRIIVSTEDLLKGSPLEATYIPNTIDMQQINSLKNIQKTEGAALYTDVVRGTAKDLAKKYADEHGLHLNIHSRDAAPLLHNDYLALMGHHEYFIDVRRQYDNPELVYTVPSQGALEALAMGLKVINHNGDLIEALPEHNNPAKVITQYYDLYRGLLKQ